MKSILTLSLLFATFCIVENIWSQVPIIVTISNDDGTIDKKLPFDQPFTLRIPFKTQPITKVQYFKLYPKTNILNSLAKRTFQQDSFLHVIPPVNIEIKKIDKVNYAYVKFEYPYLLKPGHEYGIIAGSNHSEEMLTFLSEFNSNFSTLSDANKLAQLKLKYKKITKVPEAKIKSQKGQSTNVPVNFGHFPVSFLDSISFRIELKGYLDTLLVPLFKKIDSTNTLITSNNGEVISKLASGISTFSYPNMSERAYNSLEFPVYFSDTSIFQKSLLWLRLNESTSTYSNLLNGRQLYLGSLSNDPMNVDQRINNLIVSLDAMGRFYAQVNYLRSNYSAYNELEGNLLILVTGMYRNLTFLKEIKGYLAAETKLLSSKLFVYHNVYDKKAKPISQNFSTVTYYGLNSFIGDYMVKNKLTIAPDLSFGVLNPFNIRDDSHKGLDYRYFPNLGFSIGLQPINKDVNFDTYDKTILQRTTIDIGWSLVNFAKKDEYDNFFEKSTLYTGVGFRLSNSFRLQTGAQWINSINIDKNTRVMKRIPFLGLSVDLSFKDLINGFNDVVGGYKGQNIVQPETEQ